MMKKLQKKQEDRRKFQEHILKVSTDFILEKIMHNEMFEESDGDRYRSFTWGDLAKHLNGQSYCTENFKEFNSKNLQMFFLRIPQEIKNKYKPDFQSLSLLQFWHNFRYKNRGINSCNQIENLSGSIGEYEDLMIDKLDFKITMEDDPSNRLTHLYA